jgi:hypothetical protein
MAFFVFANNINTTLALPIISTATTITLASSVGLPSIPTGEYFVVTLNDAASGQIFEVLYATAVAGANLTVMRGQEGTSALNWSTGDRVYADVTAGELTSIQSYALAQNLTHGIDYIGSSGNFPVPAGVSYVKLIVTGGGGGGSNCSSTTQGANYSSGGGGGAGGTAIGIFSVTAGQIIPISIGIGGSGNGVNGGTTTVSGFCSALGGTGASFPTPNGSAGGSPGVGYGGQLNLYGGYGSDGQSGAFTGMGNGGASYWGGGARAGAVTGLSSNVPGAGGGGAYNSTSGTGGAGGNGLVMIEY